jgi:hypothetical protein
MFILKKPKLRRRVFYNEQYLFKTCSLIFGLIRYYIVAYFGRNYFRIPVGANFFSSSCRPDRLRGPHKFLSSKYRGSPPGGGAAGT